MKSIQKITATIVLAVASLTTNAQDISDIISVYRNDGQFTSFARSEVDSILFAESESGPIQLVYAGDGVTAIPVSAVVSVCFENDTIMHPHAVDLGLPSGTLWASCNIGASSPEDFGGHYPWAMTEELEYYSPDNYAYYDLETGWSDVMGQSIGGTEYDVARQKWGGNWKMPDINEMKEVLLECRRDFTTRNGVEGLLLTGNNGNSIFLPAAGYYFADKHVEVGERGAYWTETYWTKRQGYKFAYSMVMKDNTCWYGVGDQTFKGLSVRAIWR